MAQEIADWEALGATAIGGESPGGAPVRYDPDFERLEAEVQKLESLSGEIVDWGRVVALGRAILQEKSKDLLVSSYLAFGLLETEGYGGLSNGLACLEGLISEFWSTLYPEKKRMRARVNALNWLSEKAGAEVARQDPQAGEAEALEACATRLQSLQATLEEKAGPDAPGLVELRRALEERRRRLSSPEPARAASREEAAPPAAAAAAAPAPSAAPAALAPPAAPAAAPAPPTSIETPDDAKSVLRDSFIALKRALSFNRAQDPTSPSPYRLLRALTWCDVDELPPAGNGRTRIPPPPAHVRDRCRSLAEQASWAELSSEVEGRVGEFPFWLDLHRRGEQALAGLGPSHAKAREALSGEVATLLSRLPELADLEFSDGTPFADEETRSWISTALFPAEEPEPPAGAKEGAGEDARDELAQKARKLIRDEKTEEAVSLLQEGMRTASTERSRFLLRLDLARCCVEIKQAKAALAHLEALDEQIGRFQLEAWEPEVSAEVLETYWRVLSEVVKGAKAPASDLTARVEGLYGRLCRLDVGAGLRLSEQKPRASGRGAVSPRRRTARPPKKGKKS